MFARTCFAVPGESDRAKGGMPMDQDRLQSISQTSARRFGRLAAAGAVLIWAVWVVGTRQAVTHAVDPFALGLLRFGVPAVVFLPIWWRLGGRPKGLSPLLMIGLMGAGAPFFILVAIAMRDASAAEIGPLLPGTMPLMVALFSGLLFGERFSRCQGLGIVLIVAGVAAIGGEDMLIGAKSWRAHALLLSGAGLWATYTVSFKRSGLSSLAATALISLWSTLALLPWGLAGLWTGVRNGLGGIVLIQSIIQGLFSGVLAILLYGAAVTRLGATAGAAFVALVPALAAVIAIPVLGEWPTPGAVIGIAATTVGVAMMTATSSRDDGGTAEKPLPPPAISVNRR
jgi:drug/metabolite transporter (DMT)-like permease